MLRNGELHQETLSQGNNGHLPLASTQAQRHLDRHLDRNRVGAMAEWVKALTAKPDGLSSIPRTHKVDGENHFSQIVL